MTHASDGNGSTQSALAARQLAELVLSMGMVTDKGLVARKLAREVLSIEDHGRAPAAAPIIMQSPANGRVPALSSDDEVARAIDYAEQNMLTLDEAWVELEKQDVRAIAQGAVVCMSKVDRSPSLMVVVGVAGAGKTEFVQNMASWLARPLLYCSPEVGASGSKKQEFMVEPDWGEIWGIAIDEVACWDRASLTSTLVKLRAEAAAHGRKIILIVQHLGQLEEIGIEWSEAVPRLTLRPEFFCPSV